MKKETIRRATILFALMIFLTGVVSSVFFSLAPSEWTYPTEVVNTLKACDWCENNASVYYEHCPHCFGGMTCDVCTDYYRKHFNLTQETFPCYCWHSDEWAPNKLEWFFMQHF